MLNNRPIAIFKENRIYFKVEFTRKKCKTAILIFVVLFPYCRRTSHIWALEYHFIENLKLVLKENQIIK